MYVLSYFSYLNVYIILQEIVFHSQKEVIWEELLGKMEDRQIIIIERFQRVKKSCRKKKYDTSCVKCKIENGKTLGRSGYSSIQYWLDEIWKDKEWDDYVKINHLQDMVDEKNEPIPFGLDGSKIDKKKLEETYLKNIKMIICRGYRITHKGKLDEKEINSLYKELGIE